jgi:uncharacterized oligopeptide transporter (OPT) family protein
VKRKLIEAAPSPEVARMLLAAPKKGAEFSALKWGLVSVAVGIGLVIIQLAELIDSEAMATGVLFLAGGIGLLIYYAIATRLLRKESAGEDIVM